MVSTLDIRRIKVKTLLLEMRTFLKLHQTQHVTLSLLPTVRQRYFSKKLVQAKLSEIRSQIKQKEFDDTFQLEKENYLQRYNLTPSKYYLQRHPLLLTERSLSEIKNVLHLLHHRCGFTQETLPKVLQKYPLIIELHPDDITQRLYELTSNGFNHFEAFLRLEPSMLLSSNSTDSPFMDRLKLYRDILNEIGIENGCELLEKHCVHIIQREPKYVLGTLRFYEQIGLNMKQLIEEHPQCMIYTLSHIQKVIRFIHQHIGDHQGMDTKIIQICPKILGVNLFKLKHTISWLQAVGLFQVSEILEQCPGLVICVDVERLDESYKCLVNEYDVSKGLIQDNIWIIMLRKESIEKRIKVMRDAGITLSEDTVEMLQFDHNHIRRLTVLQ